METEIFTLCDFAQDAGAGCGDGEVGQKTRMIPVRHAGHDQVAEIFQDRVHGLALLGCGGGKAVDERSRFDSGRDGKMPGIAQVVGNPIDGLVGGGAKFLGGHAPFSVTGLPATATSET